MLISTVLAGCFLNALSECPSSGARTLADGEQVNGVSPDRAIAPILGDHVGTLTWTLPGRTTAVHLDVQRTSPSTADFDCNHNLDAFTVNVTAHLFSEDGLLDNTARGLNVDIDGKVKDPPWGWGGIPEKSLVDAGVWVAPPDYRPGFYWADVSTSIVNLTPVSGAVTMGYSTATTNTTIGTMSFP